MEFPKFQHEFDLPGEALLPHRPPFLFVDRLLSADATGALGEYTFTTEKNDFFKGHFHDFPVAGRDPRRGDGPGRGRLRGRAECDW